MGVVSPSSNAEYVEETVIAGSLSFKVVCNSHFMATLCIGILPGQFKKWVWCLLPVIEEYVEETVIAGN